tara:strand:+ start:1364 stop:1981 length:618 start_codon:yes stop_codon:yes gene_type:complete
MKKHSLFETPLWNFSISVDNSQLEKEILNIQKNNPKGVIKVNRGGWQSPSFWAGKGDSFDSESSFNGNTTGLSNLSSRKLFEPIGDTAINLPYRNKRLKDIHYWININGHMDYASQHHHCGADMSGIYYVKTPKNSSTISFFDPRKIIWGNMFFIREYEEYKESAMFDPQEGMVFLFPSFLEHSVTRNETHEDRISIAFNLFFER